MGSTLGVRLAWRWLGSRSPGAFPGPAPDAILICGRSLADIAQRQAEMSSAPLPWFSSGRTRSRHADGIRKSHRRGVRDAAPTLTVSGVCSAAMCLQRGAEALDQGRSRKGLAQETNRSGLQRPGADALIGEGRDENERRTVTLGAHKDEQVQTAHGRHLYVGNHTRRVIQVGRLQELLGRRKCMDPVAVRRQKIVRRGTDGCVIVNDGDNRKR
jgi:hypothetical protein